MVLSLFVVKMAGLSRIPVVSFAQSEDANGVNEPLAEYEDRDWVLGVWFNNRKPNAYDNYSTSGTQLL
jgi:hypothetical protein